MKDWLIIQSYIQARDIGPVPKMEGIIAQSGEASYFYALKVLHGRFERGEDSIAKLPTWAVKYARFIMRSRFERAEKHMCSSPACCYEYFKHVVKQRLPESMHQAMVMLSFESPNDYFITKYFKEVDQ
jgi:hypothetical protein